MTPFVAFILGLLIGLLVEWVIDWLYWRKRLAALQAELAQAKAKTKTAAAAPPAEINLEGQMAALADYDSLQQKSAGLEAEKAALNQQLLALKIENSSLETEKTALNQQLSALTAEKTSLVEQLDACQSKLSAPEAYPPVEAPVMPAAAVTPVEAPTVRLTKAAAVEPDDLEIIKGIGPVINRKLNQGGIYTFAQLAAITPERLREIVGDVIQRLADEDTIIAQAKELAARKAGGG